jgi:hypothetical protein
MIAEKINNNEKVWEDIYNFKIDYKELKDTRSERKKFKYKVIRSKLLYDKYGENLTNFHIYLSHLSNMSKVDWDLWLIEFDKLYNNTINIENMCQHIYKDGKKCGKFNCKIRHKNIR